MKGFGTDSFLVKPRKKTFLVVFVGKGMVMVTCFGPFPSSMLGIFLNLLILCPLIAASGVGVLLWHGWLPGLNGINSEHPWALSFGDLASFHLERCLGAYPVDFAGAWTPPEYWDA